MSFPPRIMSLRDIGRQAATASRSGRTGQAHKSNTFCQGNGLLARAGRARARETSQSHALRAPDPADSRSAVAPGRARDRTGRPSPGVGNRGPTTRSQRRGARRSCPRQPAIGHTRQARQAFRSSRRRAPRAAELLRDLCQATNPFSERRPVRGFASATKSFAIAPECSELRR